MANDTMEVVITGHLAGQLCQNVFHFDTVNVATDNPFSYAKNLADDLVKAGGFLGKYVLALPEDYIGSSIRVRQILPTLGPTYYGSASTWVDGFTGGRSGEISSAQVCPLVIWVSDNTATKTGRTFFPGVSEDDIDEMKLASGLNTAITTFMTKYIEGGTTSDIAWLGAIYRRGSATNDTIVAGYISPHIGTQRRRLTPV